MNQLLKVGIIQMTAGPDVPENACVVERMIRQAAAAGARLIVTPENTCHIRGRTMDKLETVVAEAENPVLQMAARLTAELNVHILIGSVSIPGGAGKILNRSYLYRAGRDVPVTYDKIHLFDADLGAGQVYRESDIVTPGDRAVVADVDGFKLGLSICYDVRFPHLYRKLAQAGAEVMAVPAAFAVPTGQVHWHTLLRARAIENGAYILASGQVGTHEGGRRSYGHSMIVDPWGRTMGELNDPQPGILYATLDRALVQRVRERVPSLSHDRAFDLVSYP